jgi:probable phosphoglycerate mutase
VTGRRLLLLRHGRTAWNDTGRAQGHHDVALDEVGHGQGATVAPVLAALGPAALWTSDLTRARQTCSYLERATGLTATVDRRLREYDVGARQGMTAQEFARSFPEAYAAWRAGEDMPCVPGAERATDVARRMLPALHEVLAVLDDGATGVVVTHGACLKVALVALLGWPLEQSADLRGVDNGHWVSLAETRTETGAGTRFRLRDYNRAPDSLAPSMGG